MVSKKVGLVTPALLFLGTLTVPPQVAAFDTTNLAGRPINGYSYNYTFAPAQWTFQNGVWGYFGGYGTGHGIAYAKVGGHISLLYPWHGRANSSYDGKDVYGPSGNKIGVWAPDVCFNGDCASSHDLAVITLDSGNWPADLNRVYRGSQCCGDPSYWLITAAIPTAFSCAGINSNPLWEEIFAHNFQNDNTTYWSYRLGKFKYFQDFTNSTHCRVQTDLVWHGPTSRSPWVDPVVYDDTVFGFNTSAVSVNGGPFNLVPTPLKDGMNLLYTYWQAHGSTAYICKSATCS